MKRIRQSHLQSTSDLLNLDVELQAMYTAAYHMAGLEVSLSREWVARYDAPETDPRRVRLTARQEAVAAVRKALNDLASAWTEEPAEFVLQTGMGYMDDFTLRVGDEHFKDGEFKLESTNWTALGRINQDRFYGRDNRLLLHVTEHPKPYAVLFTQRREEWQARVPDLGERIVGHGASLWEAWSACESAWQSERATLTRMPAARVKRLMDVPKAYLADAVFARLFTLFVEGVERP